MQRRRGWLLVSLALMALYVGYILWAKFARMLGSAPPLKLSETGEFLLFLAAIVAFCLQVFAEEPKRKSDDEGSPGGPAT